MSNSFEQEQEILRLIAILEQPNNPNDDYADPTPSWHELASITLFTIGEPAVPYLVQALSSKNKDTLYWCIDTLKSIEDERAVEPLLALAQNDKYGERLRSQAVNALGFSKDQRLTKPLTKLLNENPNSEIAANVIGILGSRKMIEPIMQTLSIANSDLVKQMAIYSLGYIGDAKAYDIIAKEFESKSDTVRYAALCALSQLKDSRVYELITSLLQDKDYNIRFKAASILEKIGDEQSYEPLGETPNFESLLQLLHAKSPTTRFNACEALGMLGDERVLPKLKEMALSDFEETVHQGGPNRVCDMAVEAIQRIRRKQKSSNSIQ